MINKHVSFLLKEVYHHLVLLAGALVQIRSILMISHPCYHQIADMEAMKPPPFFVSVVELPGNESSNHEARHLPLKKGPSS